MTPGIHFRYIGRLWWPFLPLWLFMRGIEFSRDGYGHIVAVEPRSEFKVIWIYLKRA